MNLVVKQEPDISTSTATAADMDNWMKRVQKERRRRRMLHLEIYGTTWRWEKQPAPSITSTPPTPKTQERPPRVPLARDQTRAQLKDPSSLAAPATVVGYHSRSLGGYGVTSRQHQVPTAGAKNQKNSAMEEEEVKKREGETQPTNSGRGTTHGPVTLKPFEPTARN